MARGRKARSKSAARRRAYSSRVIIPRKKSSELNRLEEIPFKDVELLKHYITERGRIIPRRITGTNARTQRKLTRAIKRARNIALLSFSEGYISQD